MSRRSVFLAPRQTLSLSFVYHNFHHVYLALLLGFRLETNELGGEYRRGTQNSPESATVWRDSVRDSTFRLSFGRVTCSKRSKLEKNPTKLRFVSSAAARERQTLRGLPAYRSGMRQSVNPCNISSAASVAVSRSKFRFSISCWIAASRTIRCITVSKEGRS